MPTLVLLRHGQSQWNLENRFTGWWDVDLSEQGVAEARAAGVLLRERGYEFDRCFTSVLTRAIRTLHLVLHELAKPIGADLHLDDGHDLSRAWTVYRTSQHEPPGSSRATLP